MEANHSIPNIVITVLYAIISLGILISNILIIIVVLKLKSFQTPISRLLTIVLAVYDLLTGILLSFATVNAAFGSLAIGNIGCEIIGKIRLVVWPGTQHILLLMSLEKYIAICKPLHYNRLCTQKRFMVCVLLVFFFNLFSSLSSIWPLRWPTVYRPDMYCCVQDFSQKAPLFGALALISLTVWISMAAIIITNLNVILVLKAQFRRGRTCIGVMLTEPCRNPDTENACMSNIDKIGKSQIDNTTQHSRSSVGNSTMSAEKGPAHIAQVASRKGENRQNVSTCCKIFANSNSKTIARESSESVSMTFCKGCKICFLISFKAIVLWFPWSIGELVFYRVLDLDFYRDKQVSLALLMLSMCNSLLNIFIYTWINRTFREKMKDFFLCKYRKGQTRIESGLPWWVVLLLLSTGIV